MIACTPRGAVLVGWQLISCTAMQTAMAWRGLITVHYETAFTGLFRLCTTKAFKQASMRDRVLFASARRTCNREVNALKCMPSPATLTDDSLRGCRCSGHCLPPLGLSPSLPRSLSLLSPLSPLSPLSVPSLLSLSPALNCQGHRRCPCRSRPLPQPDSIPLRDLRAGCTEGLDRA